MTTDNKYGYEKNGSLRFFHEIKQTAFAYLPANRNKSGKVQKNVFFSFFSQSVQVGRVGGNIEEV